MKICNLVPHIDEEASGPSYSVPMLCKSINELSNFEIKLATLKSRKVLKKKIYKNHIEFKQLNFLRKLGISFDMEYWLRNNAKKYDILHSHGMWMMPNVYTSNFAKINNILSVVSPRGTLNKNALIYSRVKKTLMWNLIQKEALKISSAFHATSIQEYEDIRSQGFKQPVAIIPNGISIPSPNLSFEKSLKFKKILYLGRLHPKKGLDMAIDAWSKLEKNHPNWRFDIVGKGEENYVNELKNKISSHKSNNIRILGPLYGEEKIKKFFDSDLFILPTRSENFGMVIAEAMSCSLPVITTVGAPWENLNIKNAGWVAKIDTQSITECMNHAMSLEDTTLDKMGKNGVSWMKADYSWISVAEKMIDFYKWLKYGGVKPNFIKLD